MFGKSKDIKDKVNGKEEEVVVETPKKRGRKPKVEEEVVEAPQTNEDIEEDVILDDDILHNIDRDIGAAHYMLSKRSIQEAIDSEGVRVWSDILILVDIALQDEAIQTEYVKEYKVIEAQRMEYQKAMMEAQQKQQEAQQTQEQS